jgi:hypothetical protein
MAAVSNYQEVSQRVTDALRDTFGPNVAVHTEEGEHGGIFVKIVSDKFDGLSERVKQEKIWQVLREKLGFDIDSVALVLAVGMDQL